MQVVHVANNLYATPSAVYKYKHITLEYLEIIYITMQEMINIEPALHPIEVIVKPIRNKKTMGECYFTNPPIITIDPRVETYDEIITSVCHEYRHAWQYLTKKLQIMNNLWFWHPTKEFFDIGQTPAANMSISQYKIIYPWEEDAYRIQSLWADKVKKSKAFRKILLDSRPAIM